MSAREVCDHCGTVALDELVTMTGFETVDVPPRRVPADESPAARAQRDEAIRSAPRRAERWCIVCVREHETWRASMEEATRRRAAAGGAR